MAREDCGGCKLPFYFRWLLKWNDNGTIGMGPNPLHRVVLVESDLLADIYKRIEATVGVPIGHIVFEAERAAAKATIDTMIPGRLAWLVRNRLVMHPGSRGLQHLARFAGLADAHPIYYHVFGGSMALVRNPMNRDIFAAMVVGAFESAEGLPYGHGWVELGGQLYLILMPTGEKPDIARRLVPEVTAPLPGNRHLERCPGCHMPAALGHLSWDLPNAIITDTMRGTRMSFIDGYAFSAVFRELIAELGEEIAPVIIEASREHAQRMMEETGFLAAGLGPAAKYDEFLDLLPLWGQGNPVGRDISGDALAVSIENPYSVHLLAGQLLAVYEAVEKRQGVVNIEEYAPQKVKITVGPTD